METLRWVKCPTETSKRGTVPIMRKTSIASDGSHMAHVTCFRLPSRVFLWWVAVSRGRTVMPARVPMDGRRAALGAPDIAALRQDARFPGSVYGTSGFRGSVYGYRVGSARRGRLRTRCQTTGEEGKRACVGQADRGAGGSPGRVAASAREPRLSQRESLNSRGYLLLTTNCNGIYT
jgi:hypothetical protein